MTNEHPKRPWTIWIGHWQEHLFLFFLIALIFDNFLSKPWQNLLNNFWVFISLVVIAYLSQRYHDRHAFHCFVCDKLPANGAEQAERKARRLKVHHGHYRGRFWLTMTVLIGAAVIWAPITPVADKAFLVLMSYDTLCTITHRKLQLWCPWCHNGGEDYDEPAPEPDGPPANTIDYPMGRGRPS